MLRRCSLDDFAARFDSAAYDPEARHASEQRSIAATLKEIRFHARERYWQFTPTHGSNFEARLTDWINNDDLGIDDQATMLRLVPELAFVDREDMLALYRTAFMGPVCRWLMDQENIDFSGTQDDLHTKLSGALKTTWLCGITDSFDIAQFCHVNRIPSAGHRAHWRTLCEFGSSSKISEYVRSRGIKRVVLLEDMVGSGDQSCGVVASAVADLDPGIDILFVPLVISDVGLDRLETQFSNEARCTVQPVSVIPRTVHVQAQAADGEAPFVTTARTVIDRTSARFPTTAYGYRGIGTLVVLHTNCPDNTPALLWSAENGWKPLFPRVQREKG